MQGQWPLVLGPCLQIHLPYFQPLERGHVSEGVPSDIGSSEDTLHRSVQIPHCHENSDVSPYLPSGGIDYNPEVFEQDRLLTYTGLNDYDTLRLDMVGKL